MKNIISKLLLLTISALCFYQCAEDEDIFVATTDVQPALLDVNVPGNIVLDPQFSSNTIINFSWQAADYGQPTQITYSVEVDDTADFAEPISVTSTTQLSASLTVSQLNSAIGDAGLPPFQTGTLYARVRSTIGVQSSLEQFSNVISFDVFPYTTEFPRLYIVGAYQSVSGYGTTNPEAPTIASSEFGNETNYEGFVYFGGTNLEFQLHRSGFVGEYVDGNPIYGNDGGSVTEGAAGSFTAPSEGYYLVRVNLDDGTMSMMQTDWAMTGEATQNGWVDSDDPTIRPDLDMTYNIETRLWTVEENVNPAEFKFRINDSWSLEIGDNEGDGILELGINASNLSTTASGPSLVTLDLSNPRVYTFSISPL